MSSGDIDDHLGPAGELDHLRRAYPALDTYLRQMWDPPIERSQVPFSAGIAKDGRTVFIDPRLNTDLDGIDVSPALARHEVVEWGLRTHCEIGIDYADDPRGHRLANRAEIERVVELLPLPEALARESYDDFLDPQIRRIEHLPLTSVDPRLDTYPYEDDEAILRKIREAQNVGT